VLLIWGKKRRRGSQSEILIKSIPSGLGLITNFTTQIFKEVRELSIVGLDPKHDLTNKHVTIINIAAIFGNVNTFKTTNPLLFPNARKEKETLYWKIYGIGHITNNELMF